MNKEEYDRIMNMSLEDRILYMNKGTITENLHLMIEMSEYEKQNNISGN